MLSVNDVDILSEQLFTNHDASKRQEAEAALGYVTKEINDIPIPTRQVIDPDTVNTNSSKSEVVEIEIDKENVPLSQSAQFNLIHSILQQTGSQYSMFFISQALITFYKNNEKLLSTSAVENLITQSLGEGCLKRLLFENAPKTVLTTMIHGFARLCKLTYAKEPFVNGNVLFAVNLFTNSNNDSRLNVLGAKLLSALVSEHCKFDSSKNQTFMNFSTHRRCSNNFRDECLLDIFRSSIDALSKIPSAFNNSPPVEVSEDSFHSETVNLVRDVLTYDFMAVMTNDTDEQATTQFPSSWKEVILHDYTTNVLWGQQKALPYPLCATLLEGLAGLCGIRRTFFDDMDARIQYVDRTLDLFCDCAVQNPDRMGIPHYVLLFAEAATRFVAPFGYRDLHVCRSFEKWVSLLQQLSLRYFSVPFGEEGSFTTATSLLTFWERLCHSRKMYGTHEENAVKDLELVIPDLCRCVFQCRVNADSCSKFDALIEDESECDNVFEAMINQSASIAAMTLMDVRLTVKMYADYVNQTLGPSVLYSTASTAWLFFIAGSLVSQVLVAIDQQDVEPCSEFLLYCVDCANHRHMSRDSGSNPRLFGLFVERALLHFLQNVQHILVGSRSHDPLTAVITNVFQSRLNLFQFVLNNTGHNITRGVSGDRDEETAQVMQQSIDLISDACRDITPQILSDLHFDLPPVVDLPLSQSFVTYKLRANLYKVLWQLTPHQPYTSSILIGFLQPIEDCIQNTINRSVTDERYVAGWLQDLRGVSLVLREDSQPFCDFAEWYCDQSSVFLSMIQDPTFQTPTILSSYLRFLLAFLDGSQTRYPLSQIHNHSALGLLVFKHVCSQLQAIVEVTITEEHIQRVSSGADISDKAFDMMLKPLSLSINCLHFCIQGGFVPFGAMWFYQDDTYDNTLLGLLRMLNVFPHRLFKDYRRVTQSVLELLRVMTDEETYQPLAKLSSSELESLISFVFFACEDTDTDTTPLMAGMTFLSFIAGLIKDVKQVSQSPALSMTRSCTPPPTPLQLPVYYASPNGGRVSNTPGQDSGALRADRTPRSLRQAREQLAQALEPFRGLWIRLLSIAMNIITLQDRGLSISVSVIYPIFETHPPFWYEYVEQFIAGYPERKRPVVREAVSSLTNAGETQSKFFSEIFSFRQKLRAL